MSTIGNFKGSRNAPGSAVIILGGSGDRGFSSSSSRFFVVAATILSELEIVELDRLTKRARNKASKDQYSGELKFNRSMDSTRMLMLKGVARIDDCQIVWASIEKDRVPMSLREDKGLLYQTACEEALREAVKRPLANGVRIVIDKYYPKRSDRKIFEERIMALIAKSHTGNFFYQRFR